jgi:DNA-binding response OmpR family regulator
VPASPSLSADQSRQPSILLIEDYSALAVAIASALHKFAPEHQVHVASDFAQARELAAAAKPELFVLDFDPPQSNEVEFLNSLKDAYPSARFLVIAAGTSREIAGERGLAAALHFVEKPFDLSEFGAAVQALLNRATPAATNRRGTLRDLHVIDFIQLKCVSGATAVLRVTSTTRHVGEIHFVAGQILHAATAELQGKHAFQEIVSWPTARVSETERLADAPKTIRKTWQPLLLDAVRKICETQRVSEETAIDDEVAKTGKKIVIVDDTEMLLIFVEDILSSADRTLRITTADTGVEGFELALRTAPDLVLLDYSLPDINGDEVCRRLRANEATARVPVVMMSGHVPEMNSAAARLDNVVAAIPKPFFSDQLLAAVQQALASGPLPERKIPPDAPRDEPSENVAAPEAAAPALEENFTNGSKAAMEPDLSAEAPATEAVGFKVQTTPVIEAPPESRARSGSAMQFLDRNRTPLAVMPGSHGTVAMTLSLTITSMQLTPEFRVGSLVVRPATSVASLRVESESLHNGMALQTGFDLGPVQLADGAMDMLRLVPTQQPLTQAAERSALNIGGVSVVPANSHGRLQLTPAQTGPMTVQATAYFELAAVELSHSFEVAALVLRARGSRINIALHSSLPHADFIIAGVQLNAAQTIDELLLHPAA